VNLDTLHNRAVRAEDADDIAAVQRLWGTNLWYCRLAGELGPDGALPPDHARTFLQSELARVGARVSLYLQDEHAVALTAELVPHPREPYPWLGLLLVDGSRQGPGSVAGAWPRCTRASLTRAGKKYDWRSLRTVRRPAASGTARGTGGWRIATVPTAGAAP
jgi:hypothetical protein